MKKGNNPSPTIQKILGEFKKKFCHGAYLASNQRTENAISFLTDKLQEVERGFVDSLTTRGFCQACGYRIEKCDENPCRVRKIMISHLKSGEEKEVGICYCNKFGFGQRHTFAAHMPNK